MLKNNNNLKIIEYLQSIGLCFQTTIEKKQEKNSFQGFFYFGIDPSGNKIHLGHIMLLLLAKELVNIGMQMILVLGTFTGIIGDPTMKSSARQQIEKNTLLENVTKIRESILTILKNAKINALILENHSWLSQITIGEYIEISRIFNLKEILNSKIFQAREKSNNSMYLHELSYFLLQAYDFLYLKKHYNCNLQIGGQDQWINMTSGCTIAKNLLKQNVHVLTLPLLTDEKNEKISKTSKNSYIYYIDLDKSFLFTYFNFFMLPDNIVITLQRIFLKNSLENNQTSDIKDKTQVLDMLFLTIYNYQQLSVAKIIWSFYNRKNLIDPKEYKELSTYNSVIDSYTNENYNIKLVVKKFTNINSSKKVNDLFVNKSIVLNGNKISNINYFYIYTLEGINFIQISKYCYVYSYKNKSNNI